MNTITHAELIEHMVQLEQIRQIETFDEMAQLVFFGVAQEEQAKLMGYQLDSMVSQLSNGKTLSQVLAMAFLAGCDMGRELERMLNRGRIG